jgi:hypothetical protein
VVEDSGTDEGISKVHLEYPVVRAKSGVGNFLLLKLIPEIGDVRQLHNEKVLIAHAGIDALSY